MTLTPAQAAEMLAGLWYLSVASSAFPDGEVRGQIAESLPFPAVLPNSRAVQVGQPATVFASVVNSGIDAVGCGIALATPIPASFRYQTTNPATNLVTGSPDTPVPIRGGGSQSFALFLVPTAPFPPTEVRFTFDCANSPPAPVTVGLDTLLLSASTAPVPDVVAVAQAPTSPSGFFMPGVLGLALPSRQGAFVVAASNVGATGALTVSADTGEFPFPLTISLCRTNLATADCETPAAASVTTTMATSAAAGFAVFVTSPDNVPLLPAVRRIFVRFRDTGGVIRGSTSIAVTTQFFRRAALRVGKSSVVMKVHLTTLGCPKNQVDSELMLGMLARAGHEISERRKQAECLVVNTCAFIDRAREESVRHHPRAGPA